VAINGTAMTMPLKILVGVAAALAVAFAAAVPAQAAESKLTLVAAENFYGDVARQIGGDAVSVTAVLGNPDQDPHLFEATPAIVRQIAAAKVVIYNGAAYDTWMDKLLKVTAAPGRVVIVAADLVHQKAGDNPHLWYDPPTMPAVATALAAALRTIDPAHENDYAARLKTFVGSLAPLDEKIAAIRAKYSGAPVTATEPVFGYMAAALGLVMRNASFQLATMNNTEPSARDLARFEDDLKKHKVQVMFYNTQASDRLVQRLVALARADGIPVVGVTETCPPGLSYQAWMLRELDATAKALAGPGS
jgi:zinc/manganese transport system substrate-binding protein